MNKIEITKKLYEFSLAGDWDNYEKMLHPDFFVIESEALPFAGTYNGMPGLMKVIEAVFGFFKNFEIEPAIFTEGDDHVIVVVKIKGVGKKTGQTFESNLLELFRFEGDKLIEIRPYYWDQSLVSNL